MDDSSSDFEISLICYDNANFTGDMVVLREDTPFLNTLNFDNRIEACIVTGM